MAFNKIEQQGFDENRKTLAFLTSIAFEVARSTYLPRDHIHSLVTAENGRTARASVEVEYADPANPGICTARGYFRGWSRGPQEALEKIMYLWGTSSALVCDKRTAAILGPSVHTIESTDRYELNILGNQPGKPVKFYTPKGYPEFSTALILH